MGPIAILFGGLMSALGIGAYALAENKSVTALIPLFIGVVIIALGIAARNEKWRMHAMHAAVLVALIGFVGSAVMAVRALFKEADEFSALAFGSQIALAVLCGGFVGLCVKSFIDARRQRTQEPDS